MTQAEQTVLTAQNSAKREGAVAFHHQKPRNASQMDDANSLRAYWLEGWDIASRRKNRPDMPSAEAEGFRAFQDGLHSHECRFKRVTSENTEWHNGWSRAETAKEKNEERLYR